MMLSSNFQIPTSKHIADVGFQMLNLFACDLKWRLWSNKSKKKCKRDIRRFADLGLSVANVFSINADASRINDDGSEFEV